MSVTFRVEGDFLVADVVIPHIPMNAGMKIWGWVDMPSTSYEFSTCDPTVGDQVNYYAESYSLGTNAIDVLNYPGKYIDFGDWVVQSHQQKSPIRMPILNWSSTFTT